MFTFHQIFLLVNKPAYARRAPNTKRMHERIHAVSALNPSTLGEATAIVLKMLISTKNKVTKSVMRAATTSGSIKKLAFVL